MSTQVYLDKGKNTIYVYNPTALGPELIVLLYQRQKRQCCSCLSRYRLCGIICGLSGTTSTPEPAATPVPTTAPVVTQTPAPTAVPTQVPVQKSTQKVTQKVTKPGKVKGLSVKSTSKRKML